MVKNLVPKETLAAMRSLIHLSDENSSGAITAIGCNIVAKIFVLVFLKSIVSCLSACWLKRGTQLILLAYRFRPMLNVKSGQDARTMQKIVRGVKICPRLPGYAFALMTNNAG